MSNKNHLAYIVCLALIIMVALLGAANILNLRTSLFYGDFKIVKARQSFGFLRVDRSLNNFPLMVRGKHFLRGLATHADSEIEIIVPQSDGIFSGYVGVDDSAQNNGAVVFEILAGKVLLWQSEVVRGGDEAVPFKVNLAGHDRLRLVVNAWQSKHAAHANWLDLQLDKL